MKKIIISLACIFSFAIMHAITPNEIIDKYKNISGTKVTHVDSTMLKAANLNESPINGVDNIVVLEMNGLTDSQEKEIKDALRELSKNQDYAIKVKDDNSNVYIKTSNDLVTEIFVVDLDDNVIVLLNGEIKLSDKDKIISQFSDKN